MAAAPGILTRVSGVLGAISNAPHVAIVGILPRSAAFWVPRQWVWPSRYTTAIKYINQGCAVRASQKLHLLYATTRLLLYNWTYTVHQLTQL